MNRVLVFGTFDVIHPGHINFLKQAREKGDFLIASVARDEFVAVNKRRKPIHGETERLKAVLGDGLVDEAYLSDPVPGTYSLIKRFKPDVICIGHDQEELKKNLEAWLNVNKLNIKTVTLKPFMPEKYKSSKFHEKNTA